MQSVPSLSSLLLVGLCSILMIGCGSQQQQPPQGGESTTSGSATILCDSSVYDFMRPAFVKFDSSYPQAHITIEARSARSAMELFLAGKARGIIIARGYLPDEEALMKQFGVARHAEHIFATDALVFFTSPQSLIDTLNASQIQQALLEDGSFARMFSMKIEPSVSLTAPTSSEYAAVLHHIAKGKQLKRKALKIFPSMTAVKQSVLDNPLTIGIGLLSSLATDKRFKLIKIGFQDTSGFYTYPRTVHQANIVLGKYPYPVIMKGLLFEDIRNLPWGFMTFLRHDKSVMEYYLGSGIVPDNARFNLKPADDGNNE
jgi:ABC-type phosphate transport system substrate-binding protein